MTKPKSKQNAKKAITSDHLALRELRLECGMTLKEAGAKYGLSVVLGRQWKTLIYALREC